MQRMTEKTANLQYNKGGRKLKGREILGCAKIRGAKIKGAKFKGAQNLMGIRYSNFSAHTPLTAPRSERLSVGQNITNAVT